MQTDESGIEGTGLEKASTCCYLWMEMNYSREASWYSKEGGKLISTKVAV